MTMNPFWTWTPKVKTQFWTSKKDDVVSVLTKHYSGWNYCRHILTGQEGWIPDTFMKLHGSKDSAK